MGETATPFENDSRELWYGTNLVGPSTPFPASTDFNAAPRALSVHGTRESHPGLPREQIFNSEEEYPVVGGDYAVRPHRGFLWPARAINPQPDPRRGTNGPRCVSTPPPSRDARVRDRERGSPRPPPRGSAGCRERHRP